MNNKKLKLTLYIFIICAIINKISAASLPSINKNLTPLKPSESYTHTISVDEDDDGLYQIFWKVVGNEIYFEVHCRTTGWVGFGLSPSKGSMKGADIAIGWVWPNGTTGFKDTYSADFSSPKIDDKQDWILLDSNEVNGYTILKFKRKLSTCDTHDVEIKKETNHMIFAWNDKDPVTGNNDWSYHFKNKRIRVDYLLDYKNEKVKLDESAFRVNRGVKDHKILPKDTYYYCELFEFPEFDADVQLIGYDVKVPKENRDLVHHILVHECEKSFLKNKSAGLFGSECSFDKPIPEEISKCTSSPIIAAWAVGGDKSSRFSEHVGFPISKGKTDKMYVIEYHYDNPLKSANRVDSTTLDFIFTKKLRKHDLGILILSSVDGFLGIQIPPKMDEIKFTTTCYPDCSTKFIPDDGITVISGFLHTHLTGRSVRTLLVRDNKVVSNLLDDPNYDFNYQNALDVEPIKIKKGDALILECVYNSNERNNITMWGLGTKDEMCMSFIYYYPKIKNFQYCSSHPTHENLYKFYKGLESDKLIPKIDFELNANTTTFDSDNYNKIMDMLKKVNYNDKVNLKFKQFFNNPGESDFFCGSAHSKNENIQKKNPFLVPKEYLTEAKASC